MLGLKLFDFVDKLRAKSKETNESEKKPKKDLGTCVPLHALSDAERKKKINQNDSLEEQLKGKKKPTNNDEIDFVDSTSTRDTKIKKNTLGLQEFGGYKIEPNDEEVIIPNTSRKEQSKPTVKETKKEQTAEEVEEEVISNVEVRGHSTGNTFRITGLYDFGSSTMLSGFVEKGLIRTKMKWQNAKKEMYITEIKVSSNKVDSLIRGEEGSLFVKTKGNPIVRYDDLLEFS